MLGYNGVLHEVLSAWQLLGSGYRVYSPALMRLHSPDSMSPFGNGGPNPYVYCMDDPLNRVDPSGHWSVLAYAANLFGFKLRVPTLTPVVVATAGTLTATGVALGSSSKAQRDFAIGAAVVLAVGALMAGRYAFIKRKPLPTVEPATVTTAGAPTSPTSSTSPTVTTPSTGSSQLSPATPTSPKLPVTLPPSPRPRHLNLGANAQRRPFDRSRLPPAPPPPAFVRGGGNRNRLAAERSATIRKASVQWEEAFPMRQP
ncbi:RHS repeat-associated core domain-containing protein [Stenotrophomonas sp. 278]|uniref:RHS repeat-associated core domain-containing protein n=1 Tax=Stenotrophomonas sp. 278 TaxID=2479851 RepID=UPI000F66272A|nr:RHS repeat-associated core domain-containing protein [Stenotrophomonas sp. 278]RRU14391.1 RHS repeat-associated core domain-containing protein [Stenotrophomonas sp. 278]